MIESSETPTTAASALAAQILLTCGQLSLRVTGGSMLPAMIPGDVIQFHSCAAEHAEPGDVVLFRRDDRFVVHRVVTRTIDGLLTQGDALAEPDSPVSRDDVIGKVVGISRRGIIVRQHRRSTLSLTLSRWLLGRSDLATRLLLRWYRPSTRAAA